MAELVAIVEDPIQRDRWGRPLIIQADGTTKPYVRASTVGKAIEDTYYLSLWLQRQTLRGVLAAPNLLLEVESLGPEPDRGDDETFKAWKSALDEIVQRCHEAVGSHARADLGTTMHTVFEAAALNRELPPIPDGCAADLVAWREATKGWRWLALEKFVVNDDFQVAGTLDGLILREVDGRLVAQVADFKTGRSLEFNGLGYAAQVATYTDSVLYDPHTGARAPLVSLAADLGIDPATVTLNTAEALLVHSPAGEAKCDIYTVPLDKGRAAVAMAMDVRAMRTAAKQWLRRVSSHEVPRIEVAAPQELTDAPVASPPVVEVPDDLTGLIASATTIPDLLGIRSLYLTTPPTPEQRWTAAHEEIAGARAALIKSGLVA